jgi:hypothetical protein
MYDEPLLGGFLAKRQSDEAKIAALKGLAERFNGKRANHTRLGRATKCI